MKDTMTYKRLEFEVDGVVYLDVHVHKLNKCLTNRAALSATEHKELVSKQLERELEDYVTANPNWAAALVVPARAAHLPSVPTV